MSIEVTTEPTIEEELRLVYEETPDFALSVRESIEQGKLSGRNYFTCFYGQVYGDSAMDMAHRMRSRLGVPVYHGAATPIEILIDGIEPGLTHQDNKALATLYDALMPYLS